jgi:hypothetical protein
MDNGQGSAVKITISSDVLFEIVKEQLMAYFPEAKFWDSNEPVLLEAEAKDIAAEVVLRASLQDVRASNV